MGVLAMLGGLSGVAQAASLKIEDVDATVKSESAIIQGAVQAESSAIQSGVTAEGTSIKTVVGAQHTTTQGVIGTAQTTIQGTVQTESTAVQNAVGAVQTELTTQHGMIEQGVDDALTDIAEVKALVEALAAGAPVSVCPAGGTADASGRYVTYAASRLDPIHVCDMNSGLFWEQSPSGSRFVLSPDTATPHCAALGPDWRVPEIRELVGLVDTTFGTPTANTSVFSNVQSHFYWSAATNATSPTDAWFVLFDDGDVGTSNKASSTFVWCARSGL